MTDPNCKPAPKGTYELEVVKCDGCGYHASADASYLEQIGDVTMKCPSCGITLIIKGAE